MSTRIDSQMLQIHKRCTQESSEQGGKISEKEAILLIRRAEDINSTSSSSFSTESRRGNKYLTRLMEDHGSDFTEQSRNMITKYIQTGRVPRERLDHASDGSKGSDISHSHTSHVNDAHSGSPSFEGGGSFSGNNGPGMGGSGFVSGSNRPSAGGGSFGGSVSNRPPFGGGGSGIGSGGNFGGGASGGGSVAGPGSHRPGVGGGSGVGSGGNFGGGASGGSIAGPGSHRPGVGGGSGVGSGGNFGGGASGGGSVAGPGSSRPGAGSGVTGPGTTEPVGGATGTVGPHGKIILDWHASKSTWGCHWFPMQETRPGGDPVNNLYAENGALHKLDKITGGSARDYELANNRKAVDAGRQYAWWGHCNNASEAACILQAPKHSVVMTAQDGSQVKFTKGDIQGLLVKCTPGLVDKVDFKGDRFNDASRDNPNDPMPEMFLEVMQQWSQDGIPFVLDIDSKEQVWNFPYDKVTISESDEAPADLDRTLPSGTKFYHIEMSGTGFDEKKRVYECYVQRDGNRVVDSGWIKTPNTHNNPDFMWRPHPVGDVMDKSIWKLGRNSNNPQVDPQMVYEIYMKSLE